MNTSTKLLNICEALDSVPVSRTYSTINGIRPVYTNAIDSYSVIDTSINRIMIEGITKESAETIASTYSSYIVRKRS